MSDWWAGPWECTDCNFVADSYDSAELHRRRGHDLKHE